MEERLGNMLSQGLDVWSYAALKVLFRHVPGGTTKHAQTIGQFSMRADWDSNYAIQVNKMASRTLDWRIRFGKEFCYISLFYHLQNDFGEEVDRLSLPRFLEKGLK